MSRVDIGAVAEYSTASELLARGIVPAWPSVETQPYDMIAITDKRRHRVQVKGCLHKGPKVRVCVAMRNGKNGIKAYTKNDIDFVIIRLFEFDLYYIIPVEKVMKDMLIKPANQDCRWQKYKENWALLK